MIGLPFIKPNYSHPNYVWVPDVAEQVALDAVGKLIVNLEFVEVDERWARSDRLEFTMNDGSMFSLSDTGQSCCETRYMTIDDDLTPFLGSVFYGAEITSAETWHEGDDEPHDVQFADIHTSVGLFTIANHNMHNGYYAGFSLSVV